MLIPTGVTHKRRFKKLGADFRYGFSRCVGSPHVVRVDDKMLFHFLGYGSLVFADSFGDRLESHSVI